jgi:1-acyl-sn-glycerol-3-phosphate acyltransferase
MNTEHPGSPSVTAALRALLAAVRAGPPTLADAPRGGGAATIPGGSSASGAESTPDAFDPAFVEQTAPLLEFLWSKYFRVRLLGVENIPASGPAVVAANHSGGVPYDGALLIHGVRRDHAQHRMMRPLVANFVFRSSWMSGVISRFGGVRASMENGVRLIERGELVAVFPEGLRGVGKLYRERYRLTHFGRGGFVRLARQTGAPIVPVAIVGAEEIHPVVGKLTRFAQPLGLPYIPITPTFPWLGPFGLLPVPTKWTIQIGEPLYPPSARGGDEEVLELAEAVRRRVDRMIADLLVQRRSIIFG